MNHIYLINGWAMNATTLQPLATLLEKQIGPVRVISYADYAQPTLSQSLSALQAKIPPHNVVLGWSLGGMLALQLAALQPQQAVVCMASNVRFVATEDWPFAMSSANFFQFYQQQQKQPTQNLKHFLRLCYLGEAHLKTETPTWLDSDLSPEQLLWGLDLLAQLDNQLLLNPAIPQLHLFAEQDALIPKEAYPAFQKKWPHLSSHCLSAGHAFVMSQTEQIAQHIQSFLHALNHDSLV